MSKWQSVETNPPEKVAPIIGKRVSKLNHTYYEVIDLCEADVYDVMRTLDNAECTEWKYIEGGR